ncbi:MAG TPA: NAD(P)H-dependent oxidoreductase [Sedimentisphaerales bacterium]|nr:NAD(P)H-dependent oxidoreductase [Sedimentisphaerales bacterium]
MSTILYIKASPRTGRSYSVAAADAFVESYRKTHPDDQIKTIDLFEKPLPAFDLAAATAKYKIMDGQEHSEQDRRIWDEVVAVIDEFKSADKYVMAVPMWNFSIPYRLKQYIDIIVQPGLTFTVTDSGGYEGLVKDKSVFIVYARGGDYPQGSGAESYDLQKKYLELILNFIGLTDIRSVVVEPTLAAGPDVAKRKRAEAVEKAGQMAKDF